MFSIALIAVVVLIAVALLPKKPPAAIARETSLADLHPLRWSERVVDPVAEPRRSWREMQVEEESAAIAGVMRCMASSIWSCAMHRFTLHGLHFASISFVCVGAVVVVR